MRVDAEGQASVAMRQASAEALFRVVALGAQGFVADPREHLLVLSLLFDAARRLQVNTREAFDRVRPFITAASTRSFSVRCRGPRCGDWPPPPHRA